MSIQNKVLKFENISCRLALNGMIDHSTAIQYNSVFHYLYLHMHIVGQPLFCFLRPAGINMILSFKGGGAHCRSTITHLSLKMAPHFVEILWGQKYCSPIEVGCSCTMTPHFDIIVIFTLYNIWSIERLNERNHKNILQCWKWDEILP